jgi:hypothetical protein
MLIRLLPKTATDSGHHSSCSYGKAPPVVALGSKRMSMVQTLLFIPHNMNLAHLPELFKLLLQRFRNVVWIGVLASGDQVFATAEHSMG